MNVLIVDSDKKVIQSLIGMLKKMPTINDIQFTHSALDAIKIVTHYQPDVVLLAVKLPASSGFDLLETLKPFTFKVILITLSKAHAYKAIKANACDYLLKPIGFLDLKTAISKVSSASKQNSNSKITIKTASDTFFIKVQNIMMVASDGSYCTYYLNNGNKITASHVLKVANDTLPPAIFFRTHHQYIINLNFVRMLHKIDGLVIVLTDKARIPLARRRKSEFLTAI